MLETCPNVRHLRVFEAVARLESVTRASTEVGLTQPAVTQAIAKLEQDIGEQLFERRTTGTYLTEFGRAYLVRVRRFFEVLERTLIEVGVPGERGALWSRINRMTRSQIRCHLAIAQGQSFTNGAARIGVSQASLHRAARDLERSVGAPLYRHSASGVVVTEAGQTLATGLLAASHEIETALEEARAARGAADIRIAIGTPMLDPAPFVASVMGEFTRQHPDTSVQMVNRTFDDLHQLLRSGTLDFMVGVLKHPASDLDNEPLFIDRYVVAARAGHPLMSREKVTVEDLLSYDWIISNEKAPRHEAFKRLFAGAGRMPKASIESHSLGTIRATLYDSDRLAILTEMELAPDERAGLLASLPVGNLDPSPVIGVTTRRDWLPTARQRDFLELLRRYGHKRARPPVQPAWVQAPAA